jgi:hypothetical protein
MRSFLLIDFGLGHSLLLRMALSHRSNLMRKRSLLVLVFNKLV